MTSDVRAACLSLCVAICCLPGMAHATDVVPPQADPLDALETMEYRPATVVSGTLALAGSTTLEQAAAQWADGFTRIHPDVKVTIDACGSDAGWQALLAGKADAVLSSRPFTAEELAAARKDGRKAVLVAVGFDQLAWIVHADNPVAELAWSPDVGILGGVAGRATWGRWNDGDAWASLPVRVHAVEPGSGTRWHLDRLLGGTAEVPTEITSHPRGTAVAEAVAADKGGLGLVGLAQSARAGVRRVPLVIPADAAPPADAVPGSERTPDCRPLFLAVLVPDSGDWPALEREFVAYVLSYPGQLDVAKDGLLPLTRGEIHAQQERLGWPVER